MYETMGSLNLRKSCRNNHSCKNRILSVRVNKGVCKQGGNK
jgi:hypothetical protein